MTEQQQYETRTVSFENCSAVDFIDIELLKRFPNLTGLRFQNFSIVSMPILKNIFTVELKMIQYLDLSWNKIKELEAHVFDELVELRWINLEINNIYEILHPIFAKNKKLEYVDLTKNQIRSLHPNLFDDLPRLEEVRLLRNGGIHDIFDQSNIKWMSMRLKHLFNYKLVTDGRSNKVEELEMVSFIFLR
jgi:Leucine-rich repeat (LRR) protein